MLTGLLPTTAHRGLSTAPFEGRFPGVKEPTLTEFAAPRMTEGLPCVTVRVTGRDLTVRHWARHLCGPGSVGEDAHCGPAGRVAEPAGANWPEAVGTALLADFLWLREACM